METIDDETTDARDGFMGEAGQGGQALLRLDEHHPHACLYAHPEPECAGKSGMPGNEYADGMLEHDQDVGKLLKALDDLGIANDTIVIYTTDNGPNMFSWPDAAMTPFRSEKDSNWEGAFRVPAMIRWPGHIKAGSWSNEIVSGLDWFPTLLAAAGDTTSQGAAVEGMGPDRAERRTRSIWTATTSFPISRARATIAAQRLLLFR